jgi:beta-galactosidase
MLHAGIRVIIGTPTYAFPPWLAREHPEVLAVTAGGRNKYGARQNMDIASPIFRFYAERIIRKLLEHVKDHPAVIGYQADNETKHYNTSGDSVQSMFRDWLIRKFRTTDSLNAAFGLAYWSNSLHDWNDLPSTTGNINAGMGTEFAKFQRRLVTDYLAWQVGIIHEYKRPDQFVTHNFDFEWRGLSYGIQPDVDHFEASRPFDRVGADIYHPSADRLTGREIAFCGDLVRSLKHSNYLVLETRAQSMAGQQELSYPGQLRLQAYSHLASGADMVEYWPWHSIHNSVETYWKGLLSHDLEPNPTYEEAKKIGREWSRIGDHLIHLQKKNKVALLFSNESLSALNWFPFSERFNYNDITRSLYDALYNMNVECDVIDARCPEIRDYALLVVPPLYAAPDSILERLNEYVRQGGHIVYAFKSGFCNENTQVRTTRMPGLLRAACGFSYQQFTNIGRVPLKGDPFNVGTPENYVQEWAELLAPETAKVLAWYDHPYWGNYAAITENKFGAGTVTYFGAMPSPAILQRLLARAVKGAGLWTVNQEIKFPLIVKNGINQYGKSLHYYFNYSGSRQQWIYPYHLCANLLTGKKIQPHQPLSLGPWEFMVLEEE